MELSLLLADAAQVDERNKVSALGLGWTQTTSPTPPMAVVVLAEFTTDEAGKTYYLAVDLCDIDGKQVGLPVGPDGAAEPLHIEMEIAVNPPHGAEDSEILRIPAAVQIGPLPLPPGRYRFQAKAAGVEDSLVYESFRVLPAS